MTGIICFALQLVIILVLLKVSFSLVIVVVMGFIKALPALALAMLALLILDKFMDEE